jgi:phosphoribosylcarboxyaminoimidazole (NCAIR) mutase
MEQYVIKGGNPLYGEVEIGGAKNAALYAVQILALTDESLAEKLDAFRAEQTQKVLESTI